MSNNIEDSSLCQQGRANSHVNSFLADRLRRLEEANQLEHDTMNLEMCDANATIKEEEILNELLNTKHIQFAVWEMNFKKRLSDCQTRMKIDK